MSKLRTTLRVTPCYTQYGLDTVEALAVTGGGFLRSKSQ